MIGEEPNLPIRISYWEDEEVKHVQERAVLRVGDEAVHHEGHRRRADPLSSVNTWTVFQYSAINLVRSTPAQHTSFDEYCWLGTRLPSFFVSEIQ